MRTEEEKERDFQKEVEERSLRLFGEEVLSKSPLEDGANPVIDEAKSV
jgi:hypothetical protein